MTTPSGDEIAAARRRQVEDAIGHSEICDRLLAGEMFDDTCDCPAAEGAARVLALFDRAPEAAPAEAAETVHDGDCERQWLRASQQYSECSCYARALSAASPSSQTADAAERRSDLAYYEAHYDGREDDNVASSPVSDHTEAAQAAYDNGRWCGECRYGVVENPVCCYSTADVAPPSAASSDPTAGEQR